MLLFSMADIIFSMERHASNPDEFRSNVHVGGTTQEKTLTEEEKVFCEKDWPLSNI